MCKNCFISTTIKKKSNPASDPQKPLCQAKKRGKKAKKPVCQLYITSKETERFDASVNSKELFALRKTRLQFLSL